MNEEFGLGWNDYGARFYDPAVGRFSSVDRFAEKYAPITSDQYGGNNPIKFIDVNGDSLKLAFDNISQMYNYLSNLTEISNTSFSLKSNSDGSFDIFDVTANSNDLAYSEIQKDLIDVVTSSENFYVTSIKGDNRKIDDIERFGGALTTTRKPYIMQFTEQWFSDEWENTGMSKPFYRFAYDEPARGNAIAFYLTWGGVRTDYALKGQRHIPFSEAIGHELHHAARRARKEKSSSIKEEENSSINMMNRYRASKGIGLRPLYGDYMNPKRTKR